MSTVHANLRSSRFVNLCLANFLVHLYLFAHLWLVHRWVKQEGGWYDFAWIIVAFALGVFVPGPFVAHILERYKRKYLYLVALVVFAVAMPWGAIHETPEAYAVAGMGYGVMQIALGATIVNDIVVSANRTMADSLFGWAGRMGIPLGLAGGMLLSSHYMYLEYFWWATLPVVLAFLLVAQTSIPVKAPVHMNIISLDRFLLPSSWCPMLMQVGMAFSLGAMVLYVKDVNPCVAFFVGSGIAWIWQLNDPPHYFCTKRILWSYMTCMAAWGIVLFWHFVGEWPDNVGLETLLYGAGGYGYAMTSGEVLHRGVETAEHCQRGTVQNTHTLATVIGFAVGYAFFWWMP